MRGEKMASTKKTLSKSKSASRKGPAGKGVKNKNMIIGGFILIVILVLGIEAANFLKVDSDKPFLVELALSISGKEKPCGQFSTWDAAAVGNGLLAVSDQINGRIILFDRNGNYVKAWGKKGEGADDFKEPSSVTVDASGDIYVIDPWKSNIRGFDQKGRKIKDLPLPQGCYGPRGLAWDGSNLVIADTGAHRIVKLSLSGEVLAAWGTRGSGKNQMDNPRSVAVDSKGYYYVADQENSRVQVISPTGEFVNSIRIGGKPSDLAVDSQGRLFVASQEQNFIKAYDPKGKYIGTLKDARQASGVPASSGMGMTPDGLLVVTGGDNLSLYRMAAQ